MSKNIILYNAKNSEEKSLKYFETLLLNVSQIIYLQDKSFNYICGTHCAQMFLEEGIDENAKCIVKTSDLKKDLQEKNKFVAEKKSLLIFEKVLIDTKENEHWYRIIKTPVFNNNDEVSEIVTVIQNIDELKHTESKINLFLGTLFHDLKNVIQAQIRSLELLRKGTFGNINAEQKDILDMILESSDFMKNQLYSIAQACKDINATVRLDISDFDVKELIELCIKEIKTLGQKRNVCINFTVRTTGAVMICADKSITRRIIENILNNVVSHAFENTTVEVELIQEKDRIIFSFENKSKTISNELKEQIFDKYVCSKRHRFNIGLGLYFCRKAVSAHKGKIYLENKAEQNKFIVELPILVKSDIEQKELYL